MAKNSVEQLENAQRPFIAVLVLNSDSAFLENQGSGPALNILYEDPIHVEGKTSILMRSTNSLGVAGKFKLPYTATTHAMSGMIVEYNSLSGKKYRTVVKYDKDGNPVTTQVAV